MLLPSETESIEIQNEPWRRAIIEIDVADHGYVNKTTDANVDQPRRDGTNSTHSYEN